MLKLFSDTAYGQMLNNAKTVAALKEYISVSDVRSAPPILAERGGVIPIVITGAIKNNLPAFAHPVYFMGTDRKQYVAIDVRAYVRDAAKHDTTSLDGHKVVSRLTDYELAITRTALQIILLDNGAQTLRMASGFACLVLANVVSDRIRKVFMLDANEYMRCVTAVYLYAQLCFFDNATESDCRRVAQNCISVTKHPANVVTDVIESWQSGTQTYTQLVEFLKAACGQALDRLTPTVFLNALANIWLGTLAKELTVGCIEHMPTLMAMVYLGVKERSIKQALLPTTAIRLGNRYGADNYVNGIDALLVDFAPKDNEKIFLAGNSMANIRPPAL